MPTTPSTSLSTSTSTSTTSASLNRFGIRPPFSFVDRIASQIAFYPPQPPSYTIKRHSDGARELYVAPTPSSRLPSCLFAEAALIPRENGRKQVAAALIPAPQQSSSSSSSSNNSSSTNRNRNRSRVILFSHGNAVDLAQQLPFLKELSAALARGGCPVAIACYDYQGYGESKSVVVEEEEEGGGGGARAGGENQRRRGGAAAPSPSCACASSSSSSPLSPSQQQQQQQQGYCPDHGAAHESTTADALEDGAAALRWLIEEKGFAVSDVVLYGQSLGSAVSTSLAASLCEAEKRRLKKINNKKKKGGGGGGEGEGSESSSSKSNSCCGFPSGLILHSPLASGLRVLKPSWSWWPSSLDIFPVAKAATKVVSTKCLVIHGTSDDVVPFSNGKAVFDALPKESRSEPLWIEGGGHCDLEGKREYLPRLLRFLKSEAT